MNVTEILHRPQYDLSPPFSQPEVRLKSRATLALLAFLTLAILLRVCVAVVSPNMEVSDETFATREAAHRLAYGYGLINPDWREGIRSWVFPAFLAAVMRGTEWMGTGSSGYLLGITIVLSLLSLTAVWFSFMWAYRTSGPVAAVIAAGASATWFELVYYGPKALYEVVAAHVLLPGLYLGAFGESIPERRRLFTSGLFCGLAVALRPTLAPAVLFVAVALSVRNLRLRLPAIAAGVLVPVLAFGIVDAFTWAYPFHSFIRFFTVNLVEPVKLDRWAVEHEWIRPWYWFLPVLAKRLGPLALLALVGVRRSPLLAAVALVILLTHSVVGHKEFRYIYPIIPLAVALAGVGIADVLSGVGARFSMLRPPMVRSIVGLMACVVISVALARVFPLWSRYSGNLIAFQELSRDAKVCGLALVGQQVDPVITGGYTYLHRNVPMFWFLSAGGSAMTRLTPSFNTIMASNPLHASAFASKRCWNGTCLYQREGSCTPSPADAIKFLPVE
jgi:GPI mannosyltransferase 3